MVFWKVNEYLNWEPMRLFSSLISNFVLGTLNLREKNPLCEKAIGRQAVKLIVVVTLMFLPVSLLSTLLASCSAFAFQAINWSFAIPARRTRRAEADNQETKHFQQQMHVSHIQAELQKALLLLPKSQREIQSLKKPWKIPPFHMDFLQSKSLKKKYGKFVKGTAFDFRKPLGRKYSNVDGF